MLNPDWQFWWRNAWTDSRVEEILVNVWWHSADSWIEEIQSFVQDDVESAIAYNWELAIGDKIWGTDYTIETIWETVNFWWRNITFVYYKDKHWFFINPATRRPIVTKGRTWYVLHNLNPIDPYRFLDYQKLGVRNYFNLFININTLEPLRINWKLVTDIIMLKEWLYKIQTDTYDSYLVDTTIVWWQNGPFIEAPKDILAK